MFLGGYSQPILTLALALVLAGLPLQYKLTLYFFFLGTGGFSLRLDRRYCMVGNNWKDRKDGQVQ